MASSLDRAVWMLIQRAELWQQLGPEAHDLLTEQASPHGEFFAWLDRLVLEQGSLAAPALLKEMDADEAPEVFHALASRVRTFHDVALGDEAHHELGVILDRLRLELIANELNLLSESDPRSLSDASQQRQRALYDQLSHLKNHPSSPAA